MIKRINLILIIISTIWAISLIGVYVANLITTNNNIKVLPQTGSEQPLLLNDPKKDTDLHAKVGKDTVLEIGRGTKALTFLSFPDPQVTNPNGTQLRLQMTVSKTPVDAATDFNNEYATYMGVSDATKDLKQVQVKSLGGDTQVDFAQLYNGIPVFGAQTGVHINQMGKVTSFEGNTLPDINISTQPVVSKTQAIENALNIYKKDSGQFSADNVTSFAELSIFNLGLLSKQSNQPTELVWRVNLLKPTTLNSIYFISANSGGLVYKFSNIHKSLNRQIFNCSTDGPTCLLDETFEGYIYGRSEGMPARGVTNQKNNPDGIPRIDILYDEVGLVYNYYFKTFGKDGPNGFGGTQPEPELFGGIYLIPWDKIHTIVNADANFSADGAFDPNWGVITISRKNASDVTIVLDHEYQHAITRNLLPGNKGMVYSGESGTLDEAFSFTTEVFLSRHAYGNEHVETQSRLDYYNDSFNCSPDAFYKNVYFGTSVFFLMAYGGDYNGCKVTGIGELNTMKLIYYTIATHLTPTSGFNDLYNAVNQTCSDLLKAGKASADECKIAKAAMQAMLIDQPGKCSSTPKVTPQCAGVTLPTVTNTYIDIKNPVPIDGVVPTTTAVPTNTTPATPTAGPTVTVNPTATVAPTASVLPTSGTQGAAIAVKTKLQYAKNSSGPIQIIFSLSGSSSSKKQSGQSDSTGLANIQTDISSNGNYQFFIKPSGYLSQTVTQEITTGANSITMNTDFAAGDLNNDDIINGIDYSLLSGNYNKSGIGDLNADGVVNGLDYSILNQNYGTSGAFLSVNKTAWNWK